MFKKLALGVAAIFVISIPAGAALAHDDSYDSYDDYSQHAQDHEEHGDYHGQEAYAHARAHDEGFYSPGEHAQWHENVGRAHQEFHEDHPNTWHDHYGSTGYGGWGGYYGGGYSSYYYPRHRQHRPSVSVYWGY